MQQKHMFIEHILHASGRSHTQEGRRVTHVSRWGASRGSFLSLSSSFWHSRGAAFTCLKYINAFTLSGQSYHVGWNTQMTCVCVCVCTYMLRRFLATLIRSVFSAQYFWYSSLSSSAMWSWFFWYHCCFLCSSCVSWMIYTQIREQHMSRCPRPHGCTMYRIKAVHLDLWWRSCTCHLNSHDPIVLL